uniref:NADH dehydrogenase subunit 2 n=1 Tax=Capsala katsuwoni TaxID=2904576 RepID=A0A8T9JEQ7_9PLAT|nr:NADH dehydrogenase subunit 2 [Capsala katsuwoni]UOK11875.1 NADH dehydrogenase subunit 2 [Capsala katsuwoni]
MGLINTLSCIFCILFSFLSLTCANTLNMWLFLELSVLSVVPCFFINYVYSNYYKGLLYYLLLSGVGSGLIFSGFLLVNEGGNLISFIGFLIKFCLFPVGFWIYIVGNSVSWVVIWLITCCSKICSPLLSVLFSQDYYFSCSNTLCGMSFLFCGLYFWFGVSNLNTLWINMSVASGCVLFLLFIYSNSFISYILLVFYFIWSSLCIYIISNLNGFYSVYSSSYIMFSLYSIPLSLSFLYKILSVFSLIYCSIPWGLIFLFFFYGLSEQYYLFKSWGFLWSTGDGNIF